MKRVHERLLLTVQPSCIRGPQHCGDASSMGWFPRTAAAMLRNLLDLRGKTVTLPRMEPEK